MATERKQLEADDIPGDNPVYAKVGAAFAIAVLAMTGSRGEGDKTYAARTGVAALLNMLHGFGLEVVETKARYDA